MPEQVDPRDRMKAGRGYSAWEAMQLAAILDLPLTHVGLTDTPENRKTLDDLKNDIATRSAQGAIIALA